MTPGTVLGLPTTPMRSVNMAAGCCKRAYALPASQTRLVAFAGVFTAMFVH